MNQSKQENIMNKLKKVLILFFVLLMILSLFSCDRSHKYKGDDYDLFTVAINSLVGTTGTAFKTSEGPVLEIKETDEYGRVMFYYEEGSIISSYNLLIAQKSDDEFVYYYEDYNFISKSENEFSSEDIEALKTANDWNKPINENKLICKKIKEQKNKSSFDSSLVEEEFAKIKGEKWEFTSSINELTKNEEGKSIVLAPVIFDRYGEGTRKYFVLILDEEGNFDKNAIMEITDYNNYQDQLKEFKENNNWY